MAQDSIELFFSYSHKDEPLRDELASHLKPLERRGLISSWHDRSISAGTEWKHEIDRHLKTADIILLLVSSYFISSDYCWDVELELAMQRHETGEARVIPVILRPVDWKDTVFGKLQALPRDGKPVTSWADQHEAFTDITVKVKETIKEWLQARQQKSEAKTQQSAIIGQQSSSLPPKEFRKAPVLKNNYGMQPEQRQRIVGYFIEEAKEHLNTIEQGLLNLQRTVEDPEAVNEVFRAAHSIKGGAAMLGLQSIQTTAYQMEGYFKVLKETRGIFADQKLETLLKTVFNALQMLLTHLQAPTGLADEFANSIMAKTEPVFAETEHHLDHLAQQVTI